MWRSESDTFQSFDFMNGFKQLYKTGFAIAQRQIALRKACRNLAEQSDFFDAAGNEFVAFGDDVGNCPAAFLPASGGHDAKSAMLVAALHDAHERGHGG